MGTRNDKQGTVVTELRIIVLSGRIRNNWSRDQTNIGFGPGPGAQGPGPGAQGTGPGAQEPRAAADID
jgi:hypothetical protein